MPATPHLLTDPDTAAPATSTNSSRRAVAAVGVGNAIEWYDFAIYGTFAAVLGATFFPIADPSLQLLLVFAVYGVALLIRPLGALLFGRLGDVRGRRPAMTIVIVLMGLATAAVGLLPGYLAIGVAAPVLLVLFRALQGLGAGGELGISSVFLVEHAPPGRRGFVGSLQIATMSLGIALGMIVAVALTVIAGDSGSSAGLWRVAFVAALPLGLIGWYVRARVSETGEFLGIDRDSPALRRPWRRLLTHSRPQLWRGFAIMGAGSLAFNTFFIFLPNHVLVRPGSSPGLVWLISGGTLTVTAVAAVLLGHLSDRIGRRPVVAASAAALVVLAVPMTLLAERSAGGLWVAQGLIGIGIGGILSVAMLAETFPPELRATGMAMTAGLATALIGATAPSIDQLLVMRAGILVGPGAYVALVAAVAGLAVWHWDEQRAPVRRPAHP